jgi:hypothetical protein
LQSLNVPSTYRVEVSLKPEFVNYPFSWSDYTLSVCDSLLVYYEYMEIVNLGIKVFVTLKEYKDEKYQKVIVHN